MSELATASVPPLPHSRPVVAPGVPRTSRRVDPAKAVEAVKAGIGVAPEERHHRMARRLAAGGAVETPEDATDLHIVLALLLIDATAGGAQCHVTSFDDHAPQIALALAPVLEAAQVGWAAITPDDGMRRRALNYRSPVVFVRASELALDHLRARGMATFRRTGPRAMFAKLALDASDQQPLFRRQADMLVVLDAHDTLCERAMTSMVISEEAPSTPEDRFLFDAFGVAIRLGRRDWIMGEDDITLTREGRQRLAVMCSSMGPEWSNAARSELTVTLALKAIHLWERDMHFRLDEEHGVVPLKPLGPGTGDGGALDPLRAIALRAGAVEAGARRTVERITLRGMAATYPRHAGFAHDAGRYASEMKAVYGLRTDAVPVRRSDALLFAPDHVVDVLPARADGLWLPILTGGTDAEAKALAAALERPDVADRLATPPDGPQRIGPLLWFPAGDPMPMLRDHLCDGTALAYFSRHFGYWPPLPAAWDCRRIAYVPRPKRTQVPDGIARLLARWSRPGHWLARRRLLAVTADEAALRDKIQKFDEECRNAVSFMSTAPE
ncbi:hypothetical protein [Pseudooceanicola sp. MF1-13]|uniref:hypothetical protein n=1 Tax=Pseudooceanicola sp. MF1-13 TaxID=3379095 RepID=UPI003892785F